LLLGLWLALVGNVVAFALYFNSIAEAGTSTIINWQILAGDVLNSIT